MRRRAGIVADVRRLAPTEIEAVASVLGLARLHQGDGFYLVAWQGDEPLGHLHLALTDPPELQDVHVRAEYRRQGVAAALTRHAEEEARARGFDRVRLTVSVSNTDAQAFYHRCGYGDAGVPPRRVKGPIQIRTGVIEVDDTLLVWEKRLDSAGPIPQRPQDKGVQAFRRSGQTGGMRSAASFRIPPVPARTPEHLNT